MTLTKNAPSYLYGNSICQIVSVIFPWICQMYIQQPDRVVLNNTISLFGNFSLFLILPPAPIITTFVCKPCFLLTWYERLAWCCILAGGLNNASGGCFFLNFPQDCSLSLHQYNPSKFHRGKKLTGKLQITSQVFQNSLQWTKFNK